MKFNKKISSFAILFALLVNIVPTTVFAANADLAIDGSSISFSQSAFLEGQKIRIYVTVYNHGTVDALGTVKISNQNNGKQIGTDQVVSVVGQKNDTVFVDWVAIPGTQTISAKVTPWETNGDNSGNNGANKQIFVEQDTDHDGIKNSTDPDDDNDGTIDTEDAFPLNSKEQKDTDGDGTGDSQDEDDDNDGIKDNEDALPLDASDSVDTDHDGIGDKQDTDDDGDGLSDEEEVQNTKTDPLKYDTDGDGVNDKDDAFPLDPNEQGDYDNDGIGNNADNDADNDGTNKSDDKNDLNKSPIIILSEEPGFVLPESEITLDAGPSYDEDGQIMTYEWTIEDDGSKNNDEQKSYTEKTFKTTFNESGKHKIKLKITDNNGESKYKTFEIHVFNYIPWLILLLLLIIALALYLSFKYTRQAKNVNKESKVEEKTAKVKEKTAAKTTVKRSTKNKKTPAPKAKKSNNNKKKS